MRKRRNSWKYVLSVCMIISLLLTSVSCFDSSAKEVNEKSNRSEEKVNENNDSNDNNVDTGVEEWVYEPVLNTGEKDQENLSTLSELDEDTDEVNVEVKAIEKNTDNATVVEGATVSLYVGKERKISAETDENGIAILDISGLTLEEKLKATVSAKKTVKQGKGINGTERDSLFNSFPKDSDGNYIRYSYELHSEKVDSNGNWVGEKLPVTLDKNKVDIAFAIDATGSMSGEINSVKNNITSFAETLVNNGLDVRFSIIEYRDITESEKTILHTYNGSNWYTTTESVIDVLSNIKAKGGGDTPETVIDALGMAASSSMKWRSGASKFAFVLTDAGYKNNNNYGYADMNAMINELVKQEITTSVITTSSYKNTYASLYEKTGGIYASISSSTFATEMQKLAENVITTAAGDMFLTLSEPRVLYNLSVCYLANDKTSRSADYNNSMKKMLNEYAKDVAQTTDGHVLINKVILFSTNSRMNFYDTNNKAAMSDIHIETREKDDGTWLNNLQIHSNAYPGGFYDSQSVSSNESIEKFDHLKDKDSYLNLNTYKRIQMSAIEGAGHNKSFIDDAKQYATTVTHESGHYIFEFFDEYMDQNKNDWDNSNRPNNTFFGLMDNQHDDIEMSKKDIDYSYFGGTIPSGNNDQHTFHSYLYTNSCEGKLVDLLTTGVIWTLENQDLEIGDYKATYTQVSGSSDRTATYSYAELESDDYITVTGAGVNTLDVSTDTVNQAYFDDINESRESYGDIVFESTTDGLYLTFKPEEDASYALYLMKAGESEYSHITMTESEGVYTADLPVQYGDMAEFYLVKTSSDDKTCKYYTINRSEKTEKGYIFTTYNTSVTGYVSNTEENSYTIIDDRSSFVNGDYFSVNDAVIINEESDSAMTDGEIYSVASKNAEINYDSVSWFLYKDDKWSELESEVLKEENDNIGLRANISESGLYVLMAKKSSGESAEPVANLNFTQNSDRDSLIVLHFKDGNANTKFYNIYYSESDFTDKTEDTVVKRTFSADKTDIELNLYERDRTFYLGVEAVLGNGCRSELTKIKVTTKAADSDGDGIPDWYNDEYELWPEEGTEKDIANSDDDKDTLTNYEEYKGGSDPKNPNDPVHTTVVPVQSISLNKEKVNVEVGKTVEVSAIIAPSNATNKNVKWVTEDASVATVNSVSGNKCTVKGVSMGSTVLRAIASDGGYVASCIVNVTKRSNTITASNVKKTVSKKKITFYLKAKAMGNAKLSYASNNKYITVDKNGKVTVKAGYIGGAIITLQSEATTDYRATVKQIKISIVPSKTKLKSLKTKSGHKIGVTWGKISKVTGYQICYSTKRDFSSGTKYITVKGSSKTTHTIKKLQKNKQYYVKVRTYKTVKKINYYSSWSNVKKVKAK